MLRQAERLDTLIKSSKRILILIHESPDDDAVASYLMMYKILKKQYSKKSDFFYYGFFKSSKLLPYVEKNHRKIYKDDVKAVPWEKYDLLIILDAPDLVRCIPQMDIKEVELKTEQMKKLVIDHHNDKSPKDYNISINEHRSSTTEQIYLTFSKILKKNFFEDKNLAFFTQYGIYSDTDNFMVGNITDKTYDVIKNMRKFYPLNPEEVLRNKYRITQKAIKIYSEMIENLVIKDNFCYTSIPEKYYENNKYDYKDINSAFFSVIGMVIKMIDGVDWGFAIKRHNTEKDLWNVSFRSLGSPNRVDTIARKFLDGGGHKYSAGALIRAKSTDDVVKAILNVI